MSDAARFGAVASFIWSIADLLNGAFKKSEFQKIMLPFTVLRRLDYALDATKEEVLKTETKLKSQGLENRHQQLCKASGFSFYNTSKFTYETLLHDDAHLARNLRQYVHGFSPNVQEVFAAFNFDDAIRDLERSGLLFQLMQRFNERSKVDLRPNTLSNHEMGYVFEHLLRKFNEATNENPGEHFTPREVIRLMAELVLMMDTELTSGKGVTRTVNDCCCGTGGILTIAKERILQANPNARVLLYGQELNPHTWAIARSDLLIVDPNGKDAEQIRQGSTLSEDHHATMRFDYQLVNPPYGYEWSKDQAAVEAEAARGTAGRFGAGLPRKSDGQMLFLQHFIARMNDPATAPSYVGIIMNGSPLFTGDAGSGESEIRRWIFENDWLEAIIALPEQIFYNTGIATYIWLLSNKKPSERRGEVMLVDASGEQFWEKMGKSLGSKRRQITPEHMKRICELVRDRTPGPHVKIFRSTAFGYREIKVLRPLRLRFAVDAAGRNAVAGDKSVQRLDAKPRAALSDALLAMDGQAFGERASFLKELESQLISHDAPRTAQVIKAVVKHLGHRDAQAPICTNAAGRPEVDAELTDTERVPFGECVKTYFDRDVKPHAPDAWIDEAHRDDKDGEIGVIGYEIPFNRHFYVFQPPRALDQIDADLKGVTERIMRMLGGLSA